MKLQCNGLTVAPDITLYHTGPALDHGPLPSFFYFALSGPDSLCTDPYNQPVIFLKNHMVRVFSMTLPGHEMGLSPNEAIQLWYEDFSKGINCLGRFFEAAQTAIEFAIKEKFVNPQKMAIGGLSRGGFIAAHLAAMDIRFRHLLCFAPLTYLNKLKEFAPLKDDPLIQSYNLIHLADKLLDRRIRISIGNHDTRVGTRQCFDFAMAISEKKKNAPLEMHIYPSVGQMGHGTPPDIFKAGADWIAQALV